MQSSQRIDTTEASCLHGRKDDFLVVMTGTSLLDHQRKGLNAERKVVQRCSQKVSNKCKDQLKESNMSAFKSGIMASISTLKPVSFAERKLPDVNEKQRYQFKSKGAKSKKKETKQTGSKGDSSSTACDETTVASIAGEPLETQPHPLNGEPETNTIMLSPDKIKCLVELDKEFNSIINCHKSLKLFDRAEDDESVDEYLCGLPNCEHETLPELDATSLSDADTNKSKEGRHALLDRNRPLGIHDNTNEQNDIDINAQSIVNSVSSSSSLSAALPDALQIAESADNDVLCNNDQPWSAQDLIDTQSDYIEDVMTERPSHTAQDLVFEEGHQELVLNGTMKMLQAKVKDADDESAQVNVVTHIGNDDIVSDPATGTGLHYFCEDQQFPRLSSKQKLASRATHVPDKSSVFKSSLHKQHTEMMPIPAEGPSERSANSQSLYMSFVETVFVAVEKNLLIDSHLTKYRGQEEAHSNELDTEKPCNLSASGIGIAIEPLPKGSTLLWHMAPPKLDLHPSLVVEYLCPQYESARDLGDHQADMEDEEDESSWQSVGRDQEAEAMHGATMLDPHSHTRIPRRSSLQYPSLPIYQNEIAFFRKGTEHESLLSPTSGSMPHQGTEGGGSGHVRTIMEMRKQMANTKLQQEKQVVEFSALQHHYDVMNLDPRRTVSLPATPIASAKDMTLPTGYDVSMVELKKQRQQLDERLHHRLSCCIDDDAGQENVNARATAESKMDAMSPPDAIRRHEIALSSSSSSKFNLLQTAR